MVFPGLAKSLPLRRRRLGGWWRTPLARPRCCLAESESASFRRPQLHSQKERVDPAVLFPERHFVHAVLLGMVSAAQRHRPLVRWLLATSGFTLSDLDIRRPDMGGFRVDPSTNAARQRPNELQMLVVLYPWLSLAKRHSRISARLLAFSDDHS